MDPGGIEARRSPAQPGRWWPLPRLPLRSRRSFPSKPRGDRAGRRGWRGRRTPVAGSRPAAGMVISPSTLSPTERSPSTRAGASSGATPALAGSSATLTSASTAAPGARPAMARPSSIRSTDCHRSTTGARAATLLRCSRPMKCQVGLACELRGLGQQFLGPVLAELGGAGVERRLHHRRRHALGDDHQPHGRGRTAGPPGGAGHPFPDGGQPIGDVLRGDGPPVGRFHLAATSIVWRPVVPCWRLSRRWEKWSAEQAVQTSTSVMSVTPRAGQRQLHRPGQVEGQRPRPPSGRPPRARAGRRADRGRRSRTRSTPDGCTARGPL